MVKSWNGEQEHEAGYSSTDMEQIRSGSGTKL